MPCVIKMKTKKKNKSTTKNISISTFFIILLVILYKPSWAQTIKLDTMLLKGDFFGKDLYVQNPQITIGKDTIYTAQQVIVNDSLVLNYMQLQKSVFVIPLTKLHLKEGTPITIKIIQSQFGRARILNPKIHQ